MSANKWPDDLQTRTEEEWRAIGTEENWTNPENRQIILGALTALKIPAMDYARLKAPGRVELIIRKQEELKPGSTAAKAAPKAAATTAAPAAAAAKKGAAPKAAGTGTAAPAAGAPATVDLGPVLAKLEEQGAQIAALQATATNVETILKLLLLNPSNSDSLALAADQATLDGIAGNTLAELAGGNG